jgi:cysteinyl-tRNA synthetase
VVIEGDTVQVAGRGGLTVRRGGISTVLGSGTGVGLAKLRDLVVHGSSGLVPAGTPRGVSVDPALVALPELVEQMRARFDAAARERNGVAMASAVLDLEAAIQAWAADTDEDQGSEQARAVVRGLIVELGRAAASGLRDPREALRPSVDGLLAVRSACRRDGRYREADGIRDALLAAGLRIQDTPDGARWSLLGE